MHDTAFQIGTLAMNIYADLRTDSVLEIGSRTVNGSLRDNALPTTRYVGLDIEEGDGVDLVVEPGKPFPVEQNSFDLVMASSVFEHDSCFWITFLEMCRAARDGGYIYINAPSNGTVHRYPQDNWRFYPDAGTALARWAASQGTTVTLVESFVADRGEYVWNDFVAVFRKGRITKAMPNVFIHEHLGSSNILTWKSKNVSNPQDFPQDLQLLGSATQRADALQNELAAAEGHRDSLHEQNVRLTEELTRAHGRLAADQQQIAASQRELELASTELSRSESELQQRQEELGQTRLDLAQARSELAIARSDSLALEEERRAEAAAASTALEGAQKESARLEACLQRAQAEAAAASDALDELWDEKLAAEARLAERFEELARLARVLAEREAIEKQMREQADWLRRTAAVLLAGSATTKGRWVAVLPAQSQSKWRQRLLQRKGLFDSAAYLAANPDVANERMDPLRHYLEHGILENRPRT